MLVFCPAKINLGLWVLEKRKDGFHNIETIFYPIPLFDALEVLPADALSIHLHGIPVPGKAVENLCLQVYFLLKREFDLPPLEIHLQKNIPIGAGLGGGSSDGAGMMLLLNDLFELGLSEAEMQERIGRLGSDCPFFIQKKTVLATGRGEQMSPINLDLSGKKLLLVYPNIHVSTPWAYGQIKPKMRSNSLAEVLRSKSEKWQTEMINDFEIPVAKQHPKIKELVALLKRSGAYYAAMSGSGSTVFGLYDEITEVDLTLFEGKESDTEGWRIELLPL